MFTVSGGEKAALWSWIIFFHWGSGNQTQALSFYCESHGSYLAIRITKQVLLPLNNLSNPEHNS